VGEGAAREDPGGALTALDRAVEWTVGGLLGVLVVTAFAQVVARYVFAHPFTWVLELDILLMVWATFLAGYLGVRRDTHLGVTFVVDRLAPPARRRVRIAGRALSIALVALLGVTGVDVVDAMEGIHFTALPLGQAAMYWAIPVGCALMAVALGHALVRDWRER
jgi:TRAP-type C4-dicarboxylate transport system permease small subunit